MGFFTNTGVDTLSNQLGDVFDLLDGKHIPFDHPRFTMQIHIYVAGTRPDVVSLEDWRHFNFLGVLGEQARDYKDEIINYISAQRSREEFKECKIIVRAEDDWDRTTDHIYKYYTIY